MPDVVEVVMERWEDGGVEGRLDHVYEGPARPVEWGGKIDWNAEPVWVSGVFRTSDFQDGAGVMLQNGTEAPMMGWVVFRKHWRDIKYVPRSQAAK